VLDNPSVPPKVLLALTIPLREIALELAKTGVLDQIFVDAITSDSEKLPDGE
jgi:hypothetical protein